MTTTLSRRLWIQRTAMAAAVLPIAKWYDPYRQDSKYYSPSQLYAAGSIRLNSNENAYGPSDAARQAIMESLSEANRYPRQFISALKEEIAKREGLTVDHVMLTAGSTELLGLAGLYFGLHGGELLACHPTFDFLMVYAERLGCKWARTPVDENFQYDLNALSKLTGKDTKLIFICNPNNPTGVEIPHHDLKMFCEEYASKYPVYMDEAYLELSPSGKGMSMSKLLSSHSKLIVARTFSKVHGLAGMRIGYALAHPDIMMQRYFFFLGKIGKIAEADPCIEPEPKFAVLRCGHLHVISSSFIDDDLIASDIHNVFFQRLGRGPLDILAV